MLRQGKTPDQLEKTRVLRGYERWAWLDEAHRVWTRSPHRVAPSDLAENADRLDDLSRPL
jgi:hypothetical protein